MIGIFKLEINRKSWLELFLLFKVLHLILSLGIFFTSIIVILYYEIDIALRAYYLVWCLLMMVLVFPFYSKAKEILGMEIVNETASIKGSGSFALLAMVLLKSDKEKERHRGLKYLSTALSLLIQSLYLQEVTLENLEEANLMVNVLEEYATETPYEPLKMFCEGLTKLPDFSVVSQSINHFIKAKKLQWTRRFQKSDKKRGRNVFEITSIALSLLIGVFAILAQIVPENWKLMIMDFLTQPQWIDIIVIVLDFILFVAYWIYTNRILQYLVYPKDIQKMCC